MTDVYLHQVRGGAPHCSTDLTALTSTELSLEVLRFGADDARAATAGWQSLGRALFGLFQIMQSV